jgi:uncharacterized protein YndB with AHSA1/START domain
MTDQQGTDTVEREATLPAGPDEVWEALTDEDRLAEWLGDEREREIEEVIEGERLTFTWARPGEDASRVEFAIEAVPDGTRLVVTETQIAGPVALAGVRWESRMLRLGRAVLLVPA